MYTHWEIWLVRAGICLLEMLFLSVARLRLCHHADIVRDRWRYDKRKYQPLETCRQPKFLVWLLYTDVRTVRNQSAALRLNMAMWIAALFYIVSELLLGWLPLVMGLRIALAACSVFFGCCSFIASCMENKRRYGSALVLYKKYSGGKFDSTILDLFMLAVFLIIARLYFQT